MTPSESRYRAPPTGRDSPRPSSRTPPIGAPSGPKPDAETMFPPPAIRPAAS
eukprot:CAMPEP_0180165598 /NCGR_PEP_ID=MMETSP0986-20121125/31073_1 /TAXON_ID=697907 /ORGANISM="non described non described, Strain CCMP2293" /LENGTH=51 /DNA_ID=CAMNT_0022116621 /DNA_START=66 /DNA_END=221 /DNA_ORIENTATION=+